MTTLTIFISFFFFFFFFFLFALSEQKVTISLNTTTLRRSGDSILIQWSGISDPSNLDWIGIYSPPESAHDDFIGYEFLSSSGSWQTGSGQISFPLVNLRSGYAFRVFRWTDSEIDPKRHDHDRNPLPGTRHLLAESERVGFEPGRGPEQVHLAYTEREDEMRVMFVASDGAERRVRFGEVEGALERVEVANAERYEIKHMCDAPANESVGWRDPGFIHDVAMKDLKRGVKYYYQVGSDSDGWSEVYSFVTRKGDSDETMALMFGDMGAATPYRTFIRTQDESVSTVKWILRDIEALGDKPAFVSHIGDISYARGYAWIWDEFFNQIQPIASRVPYHVCIGNHEYDWPTQPWRPDWALSSYGKDGGGECGVPYSLRFHMPGSSSELTGNQAPATRNLYYSLDVGTVHFVYISTETNFLEGSRQYKFIKRDLESINRTKTPFVVVQGHRPMYTTSNEVRDTPLREKMLRNLEPLLVQNNVSLALWGHVHRYERFCPLNNFTCGSGPVHVVIGMAGQDWQPIWEPRPDHTDVPVFPQPERSMYRGGEFGYTRLVATKEKLTLSYVGNHDGEVHDEVTILASGEVINGGGTIEKSVENELTRSETKQWLPLFVKGASVLLLGAFVGYVVGYIAHARKKSLPANSWTPVKSEET